LGPILTGPISPPIVFATLAFAVVVVLMATSGAKSVQKCECNCNSTVSAVQNFNPSLTVKTSSKNNIHEVEGDEEEDEDEMPNIIANVTEKQVVSFFLTFILNWMLTLQRHCS
jgi:hypothetical protein